MFNVLCYFVIKILSLALIIPCTSRDRVPGLSPHQFRSPFSPEAHLPIRDFPLPSDKPGLQGFLGMINFYQRFLRNTAWVLAPFTNALKGPGKSLQWSPVLNSASHDAKLLLASVPILTHPIPRAAISLSVWCIWLSFGCCPSTTSLWFLVPPCLFSKKLSSPNPSTPPSTKNS